MIRIANEVRLSVWGAIVSGLGRGRVRPVLFSVAGAHPGRMGGYEMGFRTGSVGQTTRPLRIMPSVASHISGGPSASTHHPSVASRTIEGALAMYREGKRRSETVTETSATTGRVAQEDLRKANRRLRKKIRRMRARIRHLIEDRTTDDSARTVCVVCLDRRRARFFQPCGHFVACEICAGKLASCPICRTIIASVAPGYVD